MLTTIRDYLASRRDEPRGDHIHDLLTQPPPMARPSPALRSRIMDGLRESPQVRAERSRLSLGWLGLAAACVVVGAVSWSMRTPPSQPQSGPGIVAILPQTAAPVIRMVANSMDRPILNEAQKMMDDTRRATDAVVRAVPFAKRGG